MPAQIIPGGAPAGIYITLLWVVTALLWAAAIGCTVINRRRFNYAANLSTVVGVFAFALMGVVAVPGVLVPLTNWVTGHHVAANHNIIALAGGSGVNSTIPMRFYESASATDTALWVLMPAMVLLMMYCFPWLIFRGIRGAPRLVSGGVRQGYRHWLAVLVAFTAVVVVVHFT